jgi:hypothetical protein
MRLLLLTLCAVIFCTSRLATADDAALENALNRIQSLEEQVSRLNHEAAPSSINSGSGIQQCVCQADGGLAGACGAGCGVSGGNSDSTGTPLTVVYDKGFVLKPVDAEKTPFSMKINSWFQARHSYFDSEGPTPDQNDFEFERTRLSFSGIALSPDLKYFFQFDADDNQTQRLDLLDYFISYDIGHDQLGLAAGQMGIRVGRWKIPFNRSRHTSGLNLQFADRSMAGVFFDIDRSVGVSLYGKTVATCVPVNWELALTNGIRTNGVRPNRVGDIDRNPGISGRVYSDILGEWGSDYESDIAWHEELAVRLGAGFAFSREDIPDGPVESSRQRVVDSGARLTSILPAGADAYDVTLFALSADFRYQGWSLSTEYYFRNLTNFSGAAVSDLTDHGFLMQSGYFIVPKKLEAFGRWSRIVGDSGTLGASDQSADEVAGGIAWWIKGRNLKLSLDVTRVNGTSVNDSAVGFRPGDDGLLYRTQLQFLF